MQVGELQVRREGEEAHRRVRLEQHDFACRCQAEIHAEEVERHTVADRLKHSFDQGQEGPVALHHRPLLCDEFGMVGHEIGSRPRVHIPALRDEHVAQDPALADEEDAILAIETISEAEFDKLRRNMLPVGFKRATATSKEIEAPDDLSAMRAGLAQDDRRRDPGALKLLRRDCWLVSLEAHSLLERSGRECRSAGTRQGGAPLTDPGLCSKGRAPPGKQAGVATQQLQSAGITTPIILRQAGTTAERSSGAWIHWTRPLRRLNLNREPCCDGVDRIRLRRRSLSRVIASPRSTSAGSCATVICRSWKCAREGADDLMAASRTRRRGSGR